MNVNKIAVVLIVKNISPNMFVKLPACKNSSPVKHKVMKKIELLLCQIDLSFVTDQFPGLNLHREMVQADILAYYIEFSPCNGVYP